MHNRNRQVGIFLALAVAVGVAIFQSPTRQHAHSSHDVVLVTHDSFVMSKELVADFEKTSGLKLTLIKAGDAGSLTNRLVLTKAAPIADAVFGIDNTFAGLAMSHKLIDGDLTPTDFGDACFNYDKAWFKNHQLQAPTTIAELALPQYRGLTVVENPNTSSTGLAFLAASVDKFGEAGWHKYWQSLKDNGIKVVDGWETAYYTEFSGSSGHGNYPIVLSYASSPADEIDAQGHSLTASILDGCFRQTEYAGVLLKAQNPDNARTLINYLVSKKFQETFPTAMYMYPIDTSVPLPDSWTANTQLAAHTFGDKLDINTNRKMWLTQWSAIFE